MPEVSWYAITALLLAIAAVIASALIDYKTTAVCVALLGVVLAVLSLRDN
jgi:positive regulator of sigma E activity